MNKLKIALYYLSLILFSLVKFIGWSVAFVMIVIGSDTPSKEVQLAALLFAAMSTGWLLLAGRRLYLPLGISFVFSIGSWYLFKDSIVLSGLYLGLNFLVWGWLVFDRQKHNDTKPAVDSIEQWSSKYLTEALTEPGSF